MIVIIGVTGKKQFMTDPCIHLPSPPVHLVTMNLSMIAKHS